MRSMQSIDFGYPWWLSYGHLAVLGMAGALLALGTTLRWARWVRVGLGVVALWSLAAFGVIHFHFNVNAKAELPTENFLRSGTGSVLDMGAGTGRSSIMVLEARSKATLVASDLFGHSFDQHFGKEGSPQGRLEKNLKAAGVADRATIATADMRKLPFEAASFDAVVSCYAMDHLNGGGSQAGASGGVPGPKAGRRFPANGDRQRWVCEIRVWSTAVARRHPRCGVVDGSRERGGVWGGRGRDSAGDTISLGSQAALIALGCWLLDKSITCDNVLCPSPPRHPHVAERVDFGIPRNA